MKIRSAHIENFKGIEYLSIDLCDFRENARQLSCLIGDNGSGKTTVLQALALVISLATRRTPTAEEFDWHGFLLERIGSRGKTRVVVNVEFDEFEPGTTLKFYRKWYDALPPEMRKPGHLDAPSSETLVQLIFEQNRLTSSKGVAGLNQFLGRYYIKSLMQPDPTARIGLDDLGDIFWFDQFRNLGSASARRSVARDHAPTESWQAGVEQLRQSLVGWWGYHTSPNKMKGKEDYIPKLESRFQAVFPERRFVGLEPMGKSGRLGAGDFYFLIEEKGKIYDIAEMSSGEQAVFSLIYEFVRLDISKSIVLIDELELHLHPHEQQRLLTSLSKLGPDCQFIITTHSSFLTDAIPNENEIRLEGGVRCL